MGDEETAEENIFVFLDLKIDDENAGRVVIELFHTVAPKSCENFRALCTGEKGSTEDGVKLHYRNSVFHKVVARCLVQGGDIVSGNGSGGVSIYGPTFDDENFDIMHVEEGMVGFANSGPNTNNSQFYITTDSCNHLNGLNVIFGKVRKGLNIIKEMYKEIIPETDTTQVVCKVVNCGQFKRGEDWSINEMDETKDIYPPWPDDWEIPADIDFDEVITNIKNSGNLYYYNKNFIDSDRKYKKTLRYLDWVKTTNKSGNCNKLLKMKLNTLLNLAAVRLHRNKPLDVVNFCTQVLKIDHKNGKAYFRRGQAYMKLKEYDKSITDLKRAKTLYPNDKKVLKEYQLVKKSKISYLKYERAIFAKMFQ